MSEYESVIRRVGTAESLSERIAIEASVTWSVTFVIINNVKSPFNYLELTIKDAVRHSLDHE